MSVARRGASEQARAGKRGAPRLHVPKPLCVNMGFGIRSRATTPLITPTQLQALGGAVVIYPRLLTACAIQGMKHGIAALRDAIQHPTVLERP